MNICSERMLRDCWGCPFKCKAGRNSTCMDWIDSHQAEADEMARQYLDNGHCLWDRKTKPFVGRMKNGKWQQICKRCESVVVLNARDVYYDDYVEEWQYDCPVCHITNKLRQQKRPLAEITNDVMKGGVGYGA